MICVIDTFNGNICALDHNLTRALHLLLKIRFKIYFQTKNMRQKRVVILRFSRASSSHFRKLEAFKYSAVRLSSWNAKYSFLYGWWQLFVTGHLLQRKGYIWKILRIETFEECSPPIHPFVSHLLIQKKFLICFMSPLAIHFFEKVCTNVYYRNLMWLWVAILNVWL